MIDIHKPITIKSRWFYTLLPPLLVVMGYVWFHLLEEWRNWHKAERIEHLATNVFPLVDLLYDLQKERGYSVGSLASTDQRFQTELAGQRKNTDLHLQQLAAMSQETAFDAEDVAYHENFSQLLQLLEPIAQVRRQVDEGSAEVQYLTEHYTRFTQSILQVVGRLLVQTAGAELLNQFYLLPTLLHIGENLGQERALMTQTFASDRFAPGAYERWQLLLKERKAHLEALSIFSAPEHRELMQSLDPETTLAQADPFRQLAAARHAEGGFHVDPQLWFTVSSRMIDLLREMSGQLQQNTFQLAKKRIAWAALKYWIQVGAALVLLLAIGALALVALLSARSRLLSQEVAERKQRENELRMLHHALDQTPVTVVITDLRGDITYANQTCFRNSGYAPGDLLGHNSRILKSGHTPAAEYATMWRTVVAGEVWQGEFHNRRKDGSLFWESASISPIRDSEGTICQFMAIKKDITEQKQIDFDSNYRRLLLEQVAMGQPLEEVYALVVRYLEEISPGVVTCIALADRQQNSLFCVVPPRLVQEQPEQRFHCPSAQGIPIQEGMTHCASAACRKVSVQELDLFQPAHWAPYEEVLRRSGLHSGWSVPIIGEGGEVSGVLSGYYPGTRQSDASLLERLAPLVQLVGIAIHRQQREEALHVAVRQAQEANRAKGAFLANISHEIRTPLHVIIGTLELLQDPTQHSGQIEQVQLAHEAAQSLLLLINDLLDYAKVEAGQLRLDSVPFKPQPLMEGLLESMGTLARQKEFRLSSHFTDEAPPAEAPLTVLGDPNRLRQIVLNLLGNAIKFTPVGGTVTLLGQWGAPQNGYRILKFEVRDTGIGIPEKQRQHVFERFTQADESTARLFGGTGLGLAICRDLVTLMGGQIGVEANPFAATGSRFHFTVRVEQSPQQSNQSADPGQEASPVATPQSPSGPVARDGKLATCSILLVDDQRANLKVTQSMLVKLGCRRGRVRCATGGQQALEMFQEGRFDLVLMDCQMPVMDGYQTSRAIRVWEKAHGSSPTPIVAFTADITEENRRSGEEAGMNGFLGKPVFLDPLRAMLERYLVKN
ncbi:MAG: nitrate- and nitrite sensing domain-containing protein [Magnetococcus sp. MYC-9]